MSPRTRSLLVIAGLAASLATPARALAQTMSCADSGVSPTFGELLEFFPSDRAMGIPTDGFVRLRYDTEAPARPYVNVTASPMSNPMGSTAVNGTAYIVGPEVHWFSDQPLPPNANITVAVSDFSSSGSNGTTFHFTTGSGPSANAAIQFAGASGIDAQRNGSADLCGDPMAVEVTLTWEPVSSSTWPATEYEYVVYETRGPGIAGPVERARDRGRPTGSSCPNGATACLAFRLASADANGPVCFNVQAMDPYGRPDGNSIEQCIDPSRGNTFNGCTTSPRNEHDRSGAWFALSALGLAVAGLGTRLRRRRR